MAKPKVDLYDDIKEAIDETISTDQYVDEQIAEHPWMKELKRDPRNRKLLKNVGLNCHIILSNDSEVTGLLQYNDFAKQIEINAQPPWDSRKLYTEPKRRDDDTTLIMNWLQAKYGLTLRPTEIERQTELVAKNHMVNPLLDHLNECEAKWILGGSVPLLDQIIEKGFTGIIPQIGSTDKDFMPIALRKMLLASVAVAFEPGCQNDIVFVFIGPEGIFKSTLIKIIGGKWWAEKPPHFSDHRTFIQFMAGVWICELPEVEAAGRSTNAQIKSVLSLTVGRYIPKYRNDPVAVKVGWLLVGTANPDEAKILHGLDNRRFVFIFLGDDGKIDLNWWTENIELLWGETVHNYKNRAETGETWYLNEQWMIDLQKETNLGQMVGLPNEELIAEYVSGLGDFVPSSRLAELIKSVVMFSRWNASFTHSEQNVSSKGYQAIRKVMTKLGWKEANPARTDQPRARGYIRTEKAVRNVDGNTELSVWAFLENRSIGNNPGHIPGVGGFPDQDQGTTEIGTGEQTRH